MKASPSDGPGSSAAIAMDRMYRWQRSFYDLTRRPYLLGRDELIASLAPAAGSAVLEIGCGTGRNLIRASQAWPNARFYGYDVSGVMLETAGKSIQRAGLQDRIQIGQGDACTFDPRGAFKVERFDRIYFSYVLSMIPSWKDALSRAADLLEPGGALLIADFGAQQGIRALPRAALAKWLAMFDVVPRLELREELRRIAAARGLMTEAQEMFGGYAVLAALRRQIPTAISQAGSFAELSIERPRHSNRPPVQAAM